MIIRQYYLSNKILFLKINVVVANFKKLYAQFKVFACMYKHLSTRCVYQLQNIKCFYPEV